MKIGISRAFKAWIFLSIINVFLSPFAVAQTKQTSLQSGIWQGTLHRQDSGNIVFNFSVATQNHRTVLYIHNATERLLVDSIQQSGDSLQIQMPFFNSHFALQIKRDGSLQGNYIKNYGNRLMVMPFTAVHNVSYRYAATILNRRQLTGKWQVKFAEDSSLNADAVGEFAQDNKGIVTGTFRTPTGDYRYLEGSVNGDRLQLSGFDGGHAVLFTAKIKNDTTLADGFIYSNNTSKQGWTAFKNNTAELPDSYNITKMRPGETAFHFRFPSTGSDTVSINDTRYKNKVVIVQILGSWCPNCMDETMFLSRYYNENKSRGIEIIGLAYERTEDFSESKEALQPFQKRFNVQYPFLITGVTVSDTQRTEKTLPQLDNIQAFPTTIFINKQGQVDKIHTGYDGPATGVHYEVFKKEFEEEIDKLLKE